MNRREFGGRFGRGLLGLTAFTALPACDVGIKISVVETVPIELAPFRDEPGLILPVPKHQERYTEKFTAEVKELGRSSTVLVYAPPAGTPEVPLIAPLSGKFEAWQGEKGSGFWIRTENQMIDAYMAPRQLLEETFQMSEIKAGEQIGVLKESFDPLGTMFSGVIDPSPKLYDLLKSVGEDVRLLLRVSTFSTPSIPSTSA